MFRSSHTMKRMFFCFPVAGWSFDAFFFPVPRLGGFAPFFQRKDSPSMRRSRRPFSFSEGSAKVAGAALRLARFNTQIDTVDKRFFVGLPSPSAAAIVAGYVWTVHELEQTGLLMALTILVVAGAGVLMVSNVKYHSFKEFDMKKRVPFTALLIIVLIFAVIALEPSFVLFAGFAIYVLSGPFNAVSGRMRDKNAAKDK